jgi:hypothetical protein
MSSGDMRILSGIRKTSCQEVARGFQTKNLIQELCRATIFYHISLASLSGLT